MGVKSVSTIYLELIVYYDTMLKFHKYLSFG